MDEKNQQGRPQDWKPHVALQILSKIWMVLFSVIKIAAGALATVLLIVLISGFVFVGMLGDFLQGDILPEANINLEDLTLDLNSTIYYVDENKQIQVQQEINSMTSREWVSYDQIPEDMIHAAIAVEDHRFYKHQGVDWVTTIQACARMFFGDSSVGGSSITQQLVKNTFGNPSVTVQRKLLEIFQATELEKHYDKEIILEYYLNVIYLGQNCYGVRTAAEAYYGKELEKLTAAECASIIGITNSPTYYDPYQNPENNRERKETILWLMRNQGWLTQEEYEEEMSRELTLKWGIDLEDQMTQCPNEDCGYRDIVRTFVATEDGYFCPVCNTLTPVDQSNSADMYSYHTETVVMDVARALAEKDGVDWNDGTRRAYMQKIQTGGYNIYSTLNYDIQKTVESIYTDLSRIPATRGAQQLQSGICIIDNKTGDLVALCGGVDVKRDYYGLNRATGTERQSGSSIKPISVYAPAFEMGVITPATVIKDLPVHYDFDYPYPRNFNWRYDYSRTIYQAVKSSTNTVAMWTLDMIGTDYSYDFTKNKFGISTLVDEYVNRDGVTFSDNDYGPLAMGSQTWGVTVRDMAQAFAALANNGVIREARTYTKVLDSDGNVVLNNTQNSEEILSQKSVDYMNYCLVNAARGSEADLFYSQGITVAGKTGTTSSDIDRWYCGFTGYYTAAIWCGFDQPETIKMVYGGNPAAQLFKKVMSPIHKGLKNKAVYNSRLMEEITVCLDSGLRATEACEKDVRITLFNDGFTREADAAVYEEDWIKQKCDRHVLVEYCSGGGVANDYCRLFAEAYEKDPTSTDMVKIEEKALVKITEKELKEIQKAEPYRLRDYYTCDEWIWLVDKKGKDVEFRGVDGKLEQEEKAPYKICPVHDEELWEAYQESLIPEPTEPEPSVPVEPTTPEATT